MTKERVVAIYVHRVVDREEGRLTVDGACTREAIRVGDLFRVAFRYPFPKDVQGFSKERQPVAQRHISLRVKSMMAYQRSLEELEPGMTGRFEMEGVGADLLLDNDVLASEYVSG